MPRFVRNFWIELTVDGYKRTVAMGPRSADGGFHLTVYQRTLDEQGQPGIVKAVELVGGPSDGDPGQLVLEMTRSERNSPRAPDWETIKQTRSRRD